MRCLERMYGQNELRTSIPTDGQSCSLHSSILASMTTVEKAKTLVLVPFHQQSFAKASTTTIVRALFDHPSPKGIQITQDTRSRQEVTHNNCRDKPSRRAQCLCARRSVLIIRLCAGAARHEAKDKRNPSQNWLKASKEKNGRRITKVDAFSF